MATYSTGVSATWGGVAFSEVVGLAYSYGSGTPKGRSSDWTDELGSVSLTCLGTANTSKSEYGLRKQLVVTGGGNNLTEYAQWESVAVANEVNGVTRYTVTLKLLDG